MSSRIKNTNPISSIPASRSSIKRLENEIKKLRSQLENLVAIKIYKPEDLKNNDINSIEELRSLIDSKESTLLQLKLML